MALWKDKKSYFLFLNIKPTIMKSPSLGARVFTGTRVGTRYEIMLLMTASSVAVF